MIPVEPVVSTPVLFVARGAMGAIGTRLSLRPLLWRDENDKQNSGIACRENNKSWTD